MLCFSKDTEGRDSGSYPSKFGGIRARSRSCWGLTTKNARATEQEDFSEIYLFLVIRSYLMIWQDIPCDCEGASINQDQELVVVVATSEIDTQLRMFAWEDNAGILFV
uniref:Uncharacterized protein n=1 Tax=Nelumbo nucifera TaxID=4432 RepID=A0A822ZDZ9_NELNU|nr:TPA_asm: hypothetical protein HUJ06_002644 [Nelumbo nucifera]